MNQHGGGFLFQDGLGTSSVQGSEHLVTFLEPREIPIEVAAHRFSAQRYLDLYLNNLAQSREVPNDTPIASQDVSTTTQPARSRVQIRMKIARDSAICDLLAMETLLAYAKNLRKMEESVYIEDSVYSDVAAAWTVACSYAAWVAPIRAIASLSAAGAVAGVIALAAPSAWRFYQDYQLDVVRARVQKLRRNFQDNIGAIDDASRDVLDARHYKFLRRMFPR